MVLHATQRLELFVKRLGWEILRHIFESRTGHGIEVNDSFVSKYSFLSDIAYCSATAGSLNRVNNKKSKNFSESKIFLNILKQWILNGTC